MNAAMKRFAADYNMAAGMVEILSRLADTCARTNEKGCNGDPHPSNPDPADKNENARLWGKDLEVFTARLAGMVEPAGLTVEYAGLRPCLRDGAGRYVEIPHRG